MDNSIISALIIGISGIIATILGAVINNWSKTENATSNQRLNKSNSSKNKKQIFSLLTVGVILIMIGSGIYFKNYFSNDTEVIANYWLGDWISYEGWRNGITSIGSITIKLNKNLEGVSYNMNLEKSTLENLVQNGDTLRGVWKNGKTRKEGEFKFVKKDDHRFEGYYTLNGKQKKWNGERFEKFYTHEVNAELSWNKKIGLRDRSLTKEEYRQINNGDEKLKKETRIGEIKHKTPMKLIKEKYSSYKILVPFEGELRIGFITNEYQKENTIREK